MEVAFRLDRDGILDQVTVALKDGSGRQVEVYPDRGGERRSRLEKKMDQLRKEWAEKRFLLDRDVYQKVDELYGQAAEAANRQDLDAFEKILQDMETRLSPEPEWKLRARGMLSYSEAAIDQFDWLIDPQQTFRLKKLNDELRRAIDSNNEELTKKKYNEVDKETDELPVLVINLLALMRAAGRAAQEGDIMQADRISAGVRATVEAIRAGDSAKVNRIFSELGPAVRAILERKSAGPSTEGVLEKKAR